MFEFGRVFNRRSFLFLVELEIKRARRYPDYLSLLSVNIVNHSLKESSAISLKALAQLFKDELRETDIIGKGDAHRLLIMLPYADFEGAHKVKERLERILRNYGFEEKSFNIDEVCFPSHATNVDDLLRMARIHQS